MTYFRQQTHVRLVLTPYEARSLLAYLDGDELFGQDRKAAERARRKLGAALVSAGEAKVRRGRQ